MALMVDLCALSFALSFLVPSLAPAGWLKNTAMNRDLLSSQAIGVRRMDQQVTGFKASIGKTDRSRGPPVERIEIRVPEPFSVA